MEDETQQLRARIAVLEAEINLLRAERSGNTDRATRDERERVALAQRETDTAAQHAQLRAFLLSAETRVKNMRARLPRTLSENLAHLYQRLPEETDSTHRGIAERLQTAEMEMAQSERFDRWRVSGTMEEDWRWVQSIYEQARNG